MNPTAPHLRRSRHGAIALLTIAAVVCAFPKPMPAADILWSSSGGSAWLTGANWTGGSVPGAGDNAQFGANPTATTVGINFSNATNAGTQTNGLRIEDVGAVEITSARTAANLTINNSTGTAGATGNFRLFGTTVNSVSNVILRSNSTQNLTLANGSTIAMNVTLGNTTENKVVLDSSGNITISSLLQSNGSATTPLTIQGAGSGRLDVTNTANTFTGAVNVNGGEVRFAANGSLGNAANTVTVDGGRLAIVSGNTVDLSSRSILLGATSGTSISAVGSTGTLTYNSALADKTGAVGILVKQGAGILSLGGASTYTGSTAINNGTVQLTTGNDRLPTGTAVSLGQAASANLGILDLNGRSQQLAGLNSVNGTNATAAKNTVTSATAATLTLGGNGTYAYGDGTTTNSGALTGSLAVSKTGSGTQIFGDANTYSGGTSVTGGKLLVANTTGSATGTGTVSIGTGGTLASGAGSVGIITGAVSTVGVSSMISPGATAAANTGTVGALTLSGGLNLANGATIPFDLSSTSGSDVIDVSGGTLTGSTAAGGVTFAFNTTETSGTYKLIDFTGVTTVSDFDVTDFAATGAAGTFTITGSELDFTAAPVPEPATVVGSLLLVGASGWSQRRRLRAACAGSRRLSRAA